MNVRNSCCRLVNQVRFSSRFACVQPKTSKQIYPIVLDTISSACCQTTRHVHMLKTDDNKNFSPDEVRRAVKAQFASSSQEGHTCFSIDCPSCKETSSNPGKLNINLTTGYTFCTSCFLHGPWSGLASFLQSFQEHQTNPKRTPYPPSLSDYLSLDLAVPGNEAKQIAKLWSAAEPVSHVPKELLQEFLAKLNLQVVTINTLNRLGAKVNIDQQQLILPCKINLDIEPQSLRIITLKRDSMSVEESENHLLHEHTVPKEHPWLLGYHLARGKDEVVLTSTAADMLVALQSLSVPVLCLPCGISQLPLATLALLDQFRKITLWLDHGIRGQESARVFAKKLGEKRCYYIRSSKDTPSALACDLTGKSVSEVFRSAVPVLHKSVTTFSKLRKEVYQEIVQSKAVAGVRWQRFPILTELLKGHRRGELTVFTGPTGAGKTTFLSEYSLDLCSQDVRTLWGSFEICNVRLAKRMLHQFSGVDLDKEPLKFELIADEFEKLPMYFMAFHGTQDVKDVLDAMSHAVYVHDISHVIIDNLQFMMGSENQPLDRFYQQDRIVGSFRQFATLNNVHITMVIHPRKEVDELSASSIFGGAKATQEADNILILQDKRATDPSNRRKYLQVVKNRYTGDLGAMPLEFHKESLSFAPPRKAKLVKRNLSSVSEGQ